MRLILLLIVFVVLGWVHPVDAEIIFLKDGKIIEGQVIERTPYQVQVLVDGDTLSYPIRQILRIVEEGENIFEMTEDEKRRLHGFEEKEMLIQRLLEALDVPNSLNTLFMQLSREAPPEAQEEIRRLMKTDVILRRIMPIYAEHYTKEDLEKLIEFYSSPLGQKHLKTTPMIMDQTMQECIRYFKEESERHD